MIGREIDWDHKLSQVRFFIEATHYEQQMLRHDPTYRDVCFEYETVGMSHVIGYDAHLRPINVSFTFGTINSLPVCYWYCCSQVCDSVKIEKWFKDNYDPKWDNGTRRAQTDPMNIHHVLEAAKEFRTRIEIR